MSIGWSFLFGFPLAFPFTVLAVRASIKERPIWIVAALTLLALEPHSSGAAQGLLLWKAAA